MFYKFVRCDIVVSQNQDATTTLMLGNCSQLACIQDLFPEGSWDRNTEVQQHFTN